MAFEVETWGIPCCGAVRYQCLHDRLAGDSASLGSGRFETGRTRSSFACGERDLAAGWGGLAAVSSATGLARSTIGRGLKDLDAPPLARGQVRREGGGPRSLTETDATLLDDLKRLVEPATLGDPVRPLLWVSKSLDKLASALVAMGHSISRNCQAGVSPKCHIPGEIDCGATILRDRDAGF